jgi:uncharacterized membrane protein YcaP (DUF421 family)
MSELVPLTTTGQTRAAGSDWAALRRNTIGRGDLLDAAREAGIFELDEIEEAFLQRNGKITVSPRR